MDWTIICLPAAAPFRHVSWKHLQQLCAPFKMAKPYDSSSVTGVGE